MSITLANRIYSRGLMWRLSVDSMRYKKKPTIVEAIRWIKPGDHPYEEESTHATDKSLGRY